jgi:ribosomal protein L18E
VISVFQEAQPANAPAEEIEVKIAAIGAMDVYELRALWRNNEGSDPPAGLTKDLLARALTYRLQEQAFGGLSASTRRILRFFEKQDSERARHIMIGSVLVREHQGKRHEVIAVPGGFLWDGRTYHSLSVIAHKITGTRWNGPRFFGLREKRQAEESPNEALCAPEGARRQPGRRSSVNARRLTSSSTQPGRYPDEADRT